MKLKISTLLKLSLALSTIFMTAVIVEAKPLRGYMALDFLGPGPNHPDLGIDPVWSGTISGDIIGNMYFYHTVDKYSGNAEHFWEVWLITDEDGNTLLTGTDKGVFTVKNDKYSLNGVVTEAYGNYEHLVGHRVHMSGIITWDPSGDPENAPGSFRVN